MEKSLGQIEQLRTVAGDAVRDVDVVVEFSNKFELVTKVIEDISSRSHMLGINAAIEAAHARDGGRGFAIVATEIKRLAESTRVSTREIAQLVEGVRASVESARQATHLSAQGAAKLAVSSGAVRDDLTTMTRIIDSTTEQMAAIASAVDEQSTTLHVVSENVEREKRPISSWRRSAPTSSRSPGGTRSGRSSNGSSRGATPSPPRSNDRSKPRSTSGGCGSRISSIRSTSSWPAPT